MKLATLIATAATLAATCAAPALADVVHLKTGGKLEGQVTLTDDGAIIRLPVGEVRVSNDAIARIEKKDTPLDIYFKRAAAIKDDDPDAHYQLGLWARLQGLKPQARDEFAKTLALQPDHEGAHKALGHRKVNGQWMTPEDEMRAKGLVQRDGDWMTPEAAAKLDALKAQLEVAREKRRAAEAQLQKAQQAAASPSYTYSGYYAGRSYVPTYPYYSTYSYGYTVPYTSSYLYVGTWPSFCYVRTYPRIYPRWGYRPWCPPRGGLSVRWSSHHGGSFFRRGGFSGHVGGGHFTGGHHSSHGGRRR